MATPSALFAQQAANAQQECAALGSQYLPIGKYEYENGTWNFESGDVTEAGPDGVTVTGDPEGTVSWESTIGVWAIYAKGGQGQEGDIILSSATLSGSFENSDFSSDFTTGISHVTFCRLDEECEATTLVETVSSSSGAGVVTLDFSNPDGITRIAFSVLNNFDVTAPSGFTETSTNVYDYTAGGTAPQNVQFILTQADTDNPNASYYATATSTCGEGSDTEFDPPHTFDVIPDAATLDGNYPNPFNPETTIRFALSETAAATLTVYDALGREVVTLLNGQLSAGAHEAVWDGRNTAGEFVPSGVYLYRLVTGTNVQTRAMTLLK